jgi:hypothetical protein
MTITRCPETGLSADYGDIIVADISEKMNLKVTYNEEIILQEIYYPDNSGSVYIRDIALLADMYQQVNDLSTEITTDAGSITLSLDFTEIDADDEVVETDTQDITLYACESETAGTLTLDVLKNIPLTRCFNKTVCPGQKEYLSFYGTGEIKAVVIYTGTTRDQSAILTLTELPESADTIHRLDVSPAVIAGLADIEQSRIVYYILYKDKNCRIKYTMNPYLRPQATFIFHNTFGTQETFTCTGDGESERKWTREYGQINRHQHLVTQELALKYTANSGYLTREQTEILEDLLNAKEISLIDEHGWHPVSIEEETFKVTSRRDELVDVEFKYRRSGQNQSQYRFNPKKYRIFDFTYDNTYN